MKRFVFVILLWALPALSSDTHKWVTAKVLDQRISSSNGGVYSMPIGTGVIGVPITRTTNRVVVDTDAMRMTWIEQGNKLIILAIGGEVQFYQDGDRFIVLDSKGKKHKFGLIGMEKKADPKPKEPEK